MPIDQADDDVQPGDQQAGDRIALDEFRRPVERAEEVRLGQFLLAPALGLGVVDRAGRHVGVDGQLPARHPVQREARADLGHAARALGDDDEVDDQQHEEDHQAQDQVAAHDELGKALDHMAGGVGAGVALADDQLGRGDVQRQPQQQRGQQDRRERPRNPAAGR